ncbi:unnamed protein product [Ixodes persulcatus]
MSYAQVHHDIMSLMFSNLATEYGIRKAMYFSTMCVSLCRLHAFFRAPLKPALKLIDGRRVKRMRSRSGRIAFQVTGEAKISYTCLQESNFCSCYSYLHQVLRKQEIPMCKHVLAARLAVALGKCEEVDCSDDTMIFVLQNLF